MSERDLKFSDDEGIQPYSPEDIPPDREVITTPYDAPVRTLIEEITSKTLIVNPEFQRQSVWDDTRKSRLIESLLLNIPIPNLFFAENDDGTRVVVDGQQRLRAVSEFHSGIYALKNLQMLPSLNRKRWVDLTSRQARIILGRTFRCVVISPKSDFNLRFEMFERLNTAGMPLTDQELRNCVYRGDLNNLLEELATDPNFLTFLGRRAPDKRLRYHELILRFFALWDNITDYKPPLKQLLNNYMSLHRRMEATQITQFKNNFTTAWRNVQIVFPTKPYRRPRTNINNVLIWESNINRSIFDIQMFSLKDIDADMLATKKEDITLTLARLCQENIVFSDALSHSTADRTRFYSRLQLWAEALQPLGLHVPYLTLIPARIQSL